MYYSERNGVRKPNNKTYEISSEAYNLLFDCCEPMLSHLSWKFPKTCRDNDSEIVGIDLERLKRDVYYKIPTLIKEGEFIRPCIHSNIFYGEEKEPYDQFAILDFIEYICENGKDYKQGYFHSYFNHYHLIFQETKNSISDFKREINELFDSIGLLYKLNDDLIVERVVSNEPQIQEILDLAKQSDEIGLKGLIDEAVSFYKTPGNDSLKNATEKLWDAFERLKTYFTDLDKKKSAEKVVSKMSMGNDDFYLMLNKEFAELTSIGNNYRIRHHETNKIEISSNEHYEYFFNRCLSLMLLALKTIRN